MKLPRTTSKMDVCFKMTTAVARLSTVWVGGCTCARTSRGPGIMYFYNLNYFFCQYVVEFFNFTRETIGSSKIINPFRRKIVKFPDFLLIGIFA